MYERELVSQLQQWSERTPHKPLVIRGARQVGKSTLVREFGRVFDVFIEVNLELQEDAAIFRQTAANNPSYAIGSQPFHRKGLS